MHRFGRRGVMLGGAAMAAGAFTTRLHAAPQPEDLRRLLDQVLPSQLGKSLPPEMQLVGEVAQGVLALEDEARARKLPASPLGRGEAALPSDPASFYQLAMPRLVALIDRGERIDPAFADKAGGLLAKLHRWQFTTPDFLGGLMPLLQRALPGKQPAAPILLDEQPLPDLGDLGVKILPPPEGEPPAADEPTEPQAVVLSRSHHFEDLAGEYATLFGEARLRPEYQDETDWHLTMMRQAKPRYQALSDRAKVPWQFIAAIHGLEASFNFRAHLHNGDFPLSQRTRQVPAGRPLKWLPPSDWESSALDALRALGFTGQSDWSLPRMLYRVEAFNGFGYRRIGVPTPYLWSFSSLYSKGKFVADGKYSAKAKSQQCGAAVMFRLLADAGELQLPA